MTTISVQANAYNPATRRGIEGSIDTGDDNVKELALAKKEQRRRAEV